MGRVDPLGLTDAALRVGVRSATGALPRTVAGVGLELGRIAIGRSDITPDPKDWRFKNPAWKKNPAFRRLGQSYLACTRASLKVVEEAPVDWRTKERARLAASLVGSALAPTNALLLRPGCGRRSHRPGLRLQGDRPGAGHIDEDRRTARVRRPPQAAADQPLPADALGHRAADALGRSGRSAGGSTGPTRRGGLRPEDRRGRRDR